MHLSGACQIYTQPIILIITRQRTFGVQVLAIRVYHYIPAGRG